MYKKINLDNGQSVILNHMPRMESAAIGIWVGTGSRNEEKRLSGISHFLEHMIFKGTPTRSTRRIKEEIEGRGGSLNAFTSEEVTCFLAKLSGRHIDVALSVLSDMVLHASMLKRDIERERTVITEEIKMYRDYPNHHVHDILNEVMWPSHPLGLPVAGSIKSVSSIVQQDLHDYKKASYVSRNMTVVLCGNIDREAVIGKIRRIFRADIKGEPVPVAGWAAVQDSPQAKVLYKATTQSHLSMGLRTFGRGHKDRYALSLLHIILGANMSSRLFENLREKRGLAYEIGTEIKTCKDTGAFIVNAGIEHAKVREAASLIIRELKKIKKKPVPIKELTRAKEFFKVQLSLGLEDTLDHMLWVGEYAAMLGRLPDKNEIIKKVSSLSARDLQRVARNVFNSSKLNLAVIGPVKDREKKEIMKELEGL